jgi:hypothetical protein
MATVDSDKVVCGDIHAMTEAVLVLLKFALYPALGIVERAVLLHVLFAFNIERNCLN